MEFLLDSGRGVSIEIRRRKGTRHLRLTLGHQNQIVTSVPWHYSDREALKFIEEQRDWLERQLAKVPPARTLRQWLVEHPEMSADGNLFGVRIEQTDHGWAHYTFENGGADMVLRLPDPDDVAMLMRVVRSFAKGALYCRVVYQAARFRLDIPKVSVRNQSSRWGSCSAKGAVSLNWRLVLLRPELQDYVILHELAHLTEMNHSGRFWALLDQYDSNREANEAALDAITETIMRVGR